LASGSPLGSPIIIIGFEAAVMGKKTCNSTFRPGDTIFSDFLGEGFEID